MIHLLMTLPWAVEPEDASVPVAQVKPAPSKVVSPVGADDPPADELLSDELSEAALELSELAAELAELVAGAAAEVAGALLEVELSSEPQALNVSAPTATKATRPLIRVIFTQFLLQIRGSSGRDRTRWQRARHPDARFGR